MKRLLTVIMIFSLLMITSILTIIDTNARCHKIIDMAEETKAYIESNDMKNAEIQQEELKTFWEDQEQIMRLYMRRDNLEDINEEMMSVSETIKLKDQCESGKSLNSIIEYCYEIMEDEKPFLHNIL